MRKESINKFFILTIFAIAMGFLETAVVIYIRNLFYPTGFNFPLVGFLDPSFLNIEWLREFATIVMLVTIAMLTAKKFKERFAYFLYAFAIWDIFYYVFLKLTLNWPASSILTPDLLFLIPWPWVGPVLAPCLVSIMFIILAFIIINSEDEGASKNINAKEWILMITGAFLVLYTWLYDYGRIITNGKFLKDFFLLSNNQEFINIVSNYYPGSYKWFIFILGYIIAAAGIVLFYFRTKK